MQAHCNYVDSLHTAGNTQHVVTQMNEQWKPEAWTTLIVPEIFLHSPHTIQTVQIFHTHMLFVHDRATWHCLRWSAENCEA